jgi:hypothetical protein
VFSNKTVIKKVLTISLLLNLLFAFVVAGFIYHKGGIEYIKRKAGVEKQDFPESYYQRLDVLNNLPEVDSAIVFVGNSIIEQCECAELFQNPKVLNRGISHDNIVGVIKREEQIVKLKPELVFILIGINDLQEGLKVKEFKRDYNRMVNELKQKLPATGICLISILPSDDIIRKNEDIINANLLIKEVSVKYDCKYIDLFDFFIKSNILNPAYTDDGLHLNGNGYLKLKESLQRFIGGTKISETIKTAK